MTFGLLISASTHAQRYADYGVPKPTSWSGEVFRLSQDYPVLPPTNFEKPWKEFDFRTNWSEYLAAVLNYCKEGNLEVDWNGAKNRTRSWYHVPWLHWGRNGREYIHGLTHERPVSPLELGPKQVTPWQNWAVGLYNDVGGYVIGKVWADKDKPDPTKALFPDGAVSIKLLFTEAPESEVPYLVGAKEWEASIYSKINIPTNPRETRVIKKLRLLQIDVAIRDDRADDTTGWVFGTFTYNGKLKGQTVWDRMVPVGLMWGNDETVTAAGGLKETIINPSADLPPQHLGWNGRLNGPVDNPNSSCLSCHSTAQTPFQVPTPPAWERQGGKEWMRWFRNLKPGTAFSPGAYSLDYSLQLAVSIRNFEEWKDLAAYRGGYTAPPPIPALTSVIRPTAYTPTKEKGVVVSSKRRSAARDDSALVGIALLCFGCLPLGVYIRRRSI
ncbi:MAG: hypothetical protein ACO1SV_01590 [Fimbriimonas sp.]